jgi:RNA polymerase primary sigma factor
MLAEADAVRNQIMEANLRLVVNIARKQLGRVTRTARWWEYQFDEHELNRLVSDGNMYLMHAIDRFDYARGFKFSTYACSAMKKNFSRDIQKSNRDSARCFNNQEEWFDGVDESAGTEDQQTSRAEAAQTYVTELLGKLDEREAAIIRMRNFEEQTLEEVGRHFGITKERVRQIEARAMRKLRGIADEDHLDV